MHDHTDDSREVLVPSLQVGRVKPVPCSEAMLETDSINPALIDDVDDYKSFEHVGAALIRGIVEIPTETHALTQLEELEDHANNDAESANEKLSITERGQLIQTAWAKKRDDPKVQQILAEYLNPARELSTKGTELVRLYYDEIGRYRLLTAADEQVLFKTIDKSINTIDAVDSTKPNRRNMERLDQASIELAAAYAVVLHCNLRLAVSIANSQMKREFDFTDLLDTIQDANLGLIRGIYGFDVSKGFKFSTYASQWIKQSVQRSRQKHANAVKIPPVITLHYQQIMSSTSILRQSLGRRPTTEEISSETGLTENEVTTAQNYGRVIMKSLDAPLRNKDDDNGATFGNTFLTDELGEQSKIDVVEAKLLITSTLSHCDLTSREKLVLSLRYGIVLPELQGQIIYDVHVDKYVKYGHPLSAIEIGKIMGFSTQSIQTTHTKALDKCRRYLLNNSNSEDT